MPTITNTGAYISTDTSFSHYIDYQQIGSNTTINIGNLTPNTRYYVKGYARIDNEDYVSSNYITFVTSDCMYLRNALSETNTITISRSVPNAPLGVILQYTLNGRNWYYMNFSTHSSYTIQLSPNQIVCFRGDNTTLYDDDNEYGGLVWRSTGNLYGGGNIISLIDKTMQRTSVPPYAFYNLFEGFTTLLTPPDCSYITEIDHSGCGGMFKGCTGLTAAPDFSSLSVIGSYGMTQICYGCTSITTSIDLSNVYEIQENGLYEAFSGCTSLDYAYDIPDVELGYGSFACTGIFRGMFSGCTSLVNPPSLDSLDTDKIEGGNNTGLFAYMFDGCTSLIEIPSLPIINTTPTECFAYMFRGCSSLDKVDLQNIKDDRGTDCFDGTFYGCSSLIEVYGAFKTFNDTNHTNWMLGVAASGIVSMPSGSRITIDSPDGVPVGWTLNEY